MEPIIIEAHLPINESGPYDEKISDAIASEALPDTGRKSANGNSSGGNFKIEHSGDKRSVKKFTSPDARKTLTATNTVKSAGNMSATDFAPETTPSVNAE